MLILALLSILSLVSASLALFQAETGLRGLRVTSRRITRYEAEVVTLERQLGLA